MGMGCTTDPLYRKTKGLTVTPKYNPVELLFCFVQSSQAGVLVNMVCFRDTENVAFILDLTDIVRIGIS